MKYALALLAAVVLSGCQSMAIQKEVVTVDRPVAFVPKPPDVPAFQSEVDKLTDADIDDPGKIGMAYKYDMVNLRARDKIFQAILEQYRVSSANFDKINDDIKKLIEQINAQEAAKVQELTKNATKK